MVGLEEEGDVVEAPEQWATKRMAASTRVGPAGAPQAKRVSPSQRRCQHGKRVDHCRTCSPQKFCPHSREKHTCLACRPEAGCIHGILHKGCRICNTAVVCTHVKRRDQCHICSPHRFCTHGRLRALCKDCGSTIYCSHGVSRYHCILCDGRKLCATPSCTTTVERVGGFCKTCVPSPSRTSPSTEVRLATHLQAWADSGQLPMTWTTWNKQIATADPAQCGRRRPDFLYLIDDEQRVVIVEIGRAHV